MINNTDLEAFGYYDQEYQDDMERCKTPMDMVKEYASLRGDIAKMLVDFMNNYNRDHGIQLLFEWDNIRAKYD